MGGLKVRARWWVPVVVALAAIVTGCSPRTQSTVVRDPASGAPLLVTALCAGERVDGVRVRQGTDDTGPVLWEAERVGSSEVRQVVLGSTPPEFRTTIGSSMVIPPAGWAEVSLSGGAAARSGSAYDAASLADLSQAQLDDLSRNADANCAEVPFRSPWWLTLSALAGTAAVCTVAVRRARRSRRRPAARAALTSPWAYLSTAFVLMSIVVLAPVGFGSRSSPTTSLLRGALLGATAMVLGLIGRMLRRRRSLDWLVLVPGLVFVMVAGLLTTIAAGGLLDNSCGAGWTFDCATSLADRVLVLACLIPAWIAAVWVGEGGWWPSLATEHTPREAPAPTGDPGAS